ncbi:MAG: hypothetical protein DMF63_10295 [Acidobacteria bacterium]|nr:MAG: hypothetical protein DMF63_10295 [Acidobacteriota bacterium]
MHNSALTPERELKDFYDAYGEDLRLGRREAIADRYDSRGYYRAGNGAKFLLTFEDSKKHYMTRWTPPKAFEWKNLTFEVLSPESAAVVGLFTYQGPSGPTDTFSYTAVLNKQPGGWRIRIEDESFNNVGYTTTPIAGDRNTPGPFKYSLTAQPGAAISAHKHTADMKITVKSGRKFILLGDLDNAKVQRFEAGSTFVIPANTWHVEWWETETVEEIEMIAPTTTVRAIPSSPRTR